MFDADPWMEEEARLDAQRDVDMEIAHMEAIGDLIAALERRGICCHGHVVGYHQPPPRPEQEGLEPGQVRCTRCKTTFSSDEEWLAAIDELLT